MVYAAFIITVLAGGLSTGFSFGTALKEAVLLAVSIAILATVKLLIYHS